MTLETVDILTIASGTENEDRAGVALPLAWVIDGATDVLPEPLTNAPSDASWFAGAMHGLLSRLDADAHASLADLPSIVADRLAPAFAAAARRPPAGRADHPSASAVIIRSREQGIIEFVSVGDCTLLAHDGKHLMQVGVAEEDAGDRWVADALTGKSQDATIQAPLSREDLWPRLHAARAQMNTPSGYGVFSITAPPQTMVRHGRFALPPGSRILLASDGLMRLVDIFRTYDAERLFASAWSNGLTPLFEELRALETADADCTRCPRAKTSDDTTAILLRVKPRA